MDFEKQRKKMVEVQLRGRGILAKNVLAAFNEVRREDFVAAKYLREAYGDYPLPIGVGQTISQPYIVALMVEKLELSGAERVLEIGTGSGYQTAVLARLAMHVYTIERQIGLASQAEKRLAADGLKNISFLQGDGTLGWPEQGPYDRIIVSAACPEIPSPLLAQLGPEGIIVLPQGPRLAQRLVVGRKEGKALKEEGVCGCSFVLLIGEYGFKEQ